MTGSGVLPCAASLRVGDIGQDVVLARATELAVAGGTTREGGRPAAEGVIAALSQVFRAGWDRCDGTLAAALEGALAVTGLPAAVTATATMAAVALRGRGVHVLLVGSCIVLVLRKAARTGTWRVVSEIRDHHHMGYKGLGVLGGKEAARALGTPKLHVEVVVPVQHGDVVVVATDGVGDNLHSKDVAAVMPPQPPFAGSAATAALALRILAAASSRSRKCLPGRPTPWDLSPQARAVNCNGRGRVDGGAVVVGVVCVS